MDPREFYKSIIMEAIDDCWDTDLLDLVYKLLTAEQDAGPTSPVMEVIKSADNSRDTRRIRPIPLQVLRTAGHTQKNPGEVGTRRAELPGLCGGADCLQSAA